MVGTCFGLIPCDKFAPCYGSLCALIGGESCCNATGWAPLNWRRLSTSVFKQPVRINSRRQRGRQNHQFIQH